MADLRAWGIVIDTNRTTYVCGFAVCFVKRKASVDVRLLFLVLFPWYQQSNQAQSGTLRLVLGGVWRLRRGLISRINHHVHIRLPDSALTIVISFLSAHRRLPSLAPSYTDPPHAPPPFTSRFSSLSSIPVSPGVRNTARLQLLRLHHSPAVQTHSRTRNQQLEPSSLRPV
jgi:hypothetical protein